MTDSPAGPGNCPSLPPAVARAGRLLSARFVKSVARRALEPLLNRVFMQALADGALEGLETGKLALHADDLDVELGFTVRNGRLEISTAENADARIAGPLAAFIWLAAREADADTLFFHRHLVMEGDTALGLAIKNVVDATDLSTLPAGLRAMLAWLVRRVPAQPPGGSASMPGSP